MSNLLTTELGHQPLYDLKKPIVLLQDEATTSALKLEEPLTNSMHPHHLPTSRKLSTYSDKPIETSEEEFMDFVNGLLGSLHEDSTNLTGELPVHLTVPRSPSPSARTMTRPLTCRETVDFVVRRGGPGSKSHNGIVEIAKSGSTIATLALERTAFKLGETIEGVIELDYKSVNCYQVAPRVESSDQDRLECRWNLQRI